jgi:hypothetical protein
MGVEGSFLLTNTKWKRMTEGPEERGIGSSEDQPALIERGMLPQSLLHVNEFGRRVVL